MAPLSKVALVEGKFDSLDDVSGPYSMLFIEEREKEGQAKGDTNNTTLVKSSNHHVDNNCTYDANTEDLDNSGCANSSCDEVNQTVITVTDSQRNCTEKRKTFVKEEHDNLTYNTETRTFGRENTPDNQTYNTEKTYVKDLSEKQTVFNSTTEINTDKQGTYTLNKTFDTETHQNTRKHSFTPYIEDNAIPANVTFDHISTFSYENLQDPNQTYFAVNKSYETLINESGVEVKRRRTSNPIVKKNDYINAKTPEGLDKPSSLPQLRSYTQTDSIEVVNNFGHSTPVKGEFTEALLRKLQVNFDNSQAQDDESSKRDSLDCEESFGILTPDRMIDGMVFNPPSRSRSPSIEHSKNEIINRFTETIRKSEPASPKDSSLGIIDDKILQNTVDLNLEFVDNKSSELQSPNVVDASITDYSLGIIDEHMMSNLTLKTDTTMNMELPLDKSKDFPLTRVDQTPSPEELPLDPTPIVESEPKTEPTKSKTTSSFVTSITSITSLDTGYQGDGEMSRPASRGADNSPLTRRPLPRNQPRRPEPMTDSDFYTESDADNHEENHLRGDRRAQVIDGTLYGVDPQAAADIYANNRENMDSSGIFTDIESNTRAEDALDPNASRDVTPSDASSKTISDNSQDNLQEILIKNAGDKVIDKSIERTPIKENPKKRIASSPAVSSPSSVMSPRHGSKEDSLMNKYKMPKRDVASKVKAMLVPSHQIEKKNLKKPVSKWDAVMNKISKSDQKTNLKEVKSKVFNNSLPNAGSVAQRQSDVRTQSARQIGNQKTLNSKPRRTRTRLPNSAVASPKNNNSNVESSIHSSLSDLSATTTSPKKLIGSAKKREVVQVTQVLTASKLSPRSQQNAPERKKTPATSSNEIKSKRILFSPKEKKQAPVKECGRGTVKGGRTSPGVRPPVQTRAAPAKQVPRVAEALAVLVQHLVFNVEAYRVPVLKREVQKFRLEVEEIRLACQHLEIALAEEKDNKEAALEEERIKCRKTISDVVEKHKNQIAQLQQQHAAVEERLRSEKDSTHKHLSRTHEEQLITLKTEFSKLQRMHEESLEILREENDAIREQIDEARAETEQVKYESIKLKEDYESREVHLKGQAQTLKSENQRLVQKIVKLEAEVAKLESDLDNRLAAVLQENNKLKEENERLLSYGDDKGIGIQEVQSLRAVLELKQNEVADLRKNLAEATQRADELTGAEEKSLLLQARCEDLQLQLQRKSEYEQNLITENQRLHESYKEEINQKKRLSQHNEELQWKLKQNKEVITKVLEQAEETAFNRSLFSSSFNERHSSTRQQLERALSFRERTYSNKSSISLEGSVRSRKSKNSLEFEMDDISPPTSPKVKGVVEKSDSVSYVLDLDESPDVVASRIVRRSFRNSTPPKNTPTKSPSNKRPRYKNNPLGLSASTSAIITTSKEEFGRSRNSSVRNGDCDSDFFISDIACHWAASTPRAYLDDKLDESCESSSSSMKHSDHLDLDEDNEDELHLPALPSELDRQRGKDVQALPSPKHLAGEVMISESNSEDESTSSSQL